ncbi:MAG: hypothetical protein E7Z84_03800 [Methanosphaera stadtmanae]|nr:hypothetical protein [Methanosphaera stadtmanae]
MNVVIKQDEKIFSFFNFIQKQFEFVKEVNVNKSKDSINLHNELYKLVLINTGTFTKFSPVIKNNLLEIPEFRDDLFYYYTSSSTMILYLWNFLKEYLEQYIYLTLNNQPADFDYKLYQRL